MAKSTRKRNFSDCEVEALISEVEAKRTILFGSLSSGISAKTKRIAWENIAKSVNDVGSENRSTADVKKKWSDIKVDVKRRVAAHHTSSQKTGGGPGVEALTPFDQRVTAVLGDQSVVGVLPPEEGDSEFAQQDVTGDVIMLIQGGKCIF